ncbi:hypothetical protein DPMN_002876 [Dreissena polymorpha]|uniref:Uncharacterized protein n=1 Tax=Dreissena polymorpha TaxID=45954 RepID=A0A9D4MKI4_DREPO|nr:hypothetical protein DPMN_002876 [Dreissena polymorpha]
MQLFQQQYRGQYSSSVWLEFCFCCWLDNYPNHSHFHLHRKGASIVSSVWLE